MIPEYKMGIWQLVAVSVLAIHDTVGRGLRLGGTYEAWEHFSMLGHIGSSSAQSRPLQGVHPFLALLGHSLIPQIWTLT